MTDNNPNVTAARGFYDAIHAGDFEQLFDRMTDDCTIEYFGPSVIPFAGIFRGKEKCRLFFGHVANDIDIQEFRQDHFMTGDNQVAVTGHLHLIFKATGRAYRSDYVHVLEIRDGAVSRFRDFQDSAKAAYACMDVETVER